MGKEMEKGTDRKGNIKRKEREKEGENKEIQRSEWKMYWGRKFL